MFMFIKCSVSYMEYIWIYNIYDLYISIIKHYHNKTYYCQPENSNNYNKNTPENDKKGKHEK